MNASFPMSVFDEEAERASQEDAGLCVRYAQAGYTLLQMKEALYQQNQETN